MDHPSSLILIDVISQCLIRNNGTARYLALSYVWGQIPDILELNRSTASTLFDIGIFGLSEIKARLPNTVKDAMRLTKSLNIRYLWVDRLCIIQDDPDQVKEQIQQMTSIYANAYVTIIAADGEDANHGLKGLVTSAAHPRYTQQVVKFPGPVEALVGPPQENPYTRWHQRGWTFQERVVSRRCIGFQNGTVFWQCKQAKWWEEIAAEPENIPKEECLYREIQDYGYSFKLEPWPNLGCYWRLVLSYTKRSLTFERDAPRAFSAVINAMSRSFPGGFHWGIPAFYFDLGLLWRNQASLQRRSEFPSWSWLGWKGDLNSCHNEYSYNPTSYHGLPLSFKFKNTIRWDICQPSDGERKPINNLWRTYHDMGNSPSAALPHGWSYREAEVVNRTNYEYHIKRIFYHQSLGDTTGFAYPVPFTEKPLGPFPDTWSPFLCFSAVRQQFAFDGSFFNPMPEYYKTHCLWMNVQSPSGMWAGVIESNVTTEADVLALKGLMCETVLISAEMVDRRIWGLNTLKEMDVCDAIKSLDVYEFCNVLWIEWKDGIAYRKAIGRIWKEVWGRQTSEEIDIIMG